MTPIWPTHSIFTYHELVPADGPISRYSVSTERFQSHLNLFRSLAEGSSATPRVSFDDGHRSNYLHAAPLLQRAGMTATFFITAGFMASRADFMDWTEVRSLLSAGHAVEAHGWSHRFLPDCSDLELARELVDAKACLEDHLGHLVTRLSCPGGRYNDRVLFAAAEAGYKNVYSSEPWYERIVTSSLTLEGRIMVRRDTSLTALSRLARHTLLARGTVYAERSLRTGLRKVLGPTYHSLWSRLSGRQPIPG
ncbi:MAG: polysaccharide deacetylase family protein [Acidobacteria bacterium]|nr:polysaccharide deacetylase family protein [Acidobacteriota bacterium]